MVQQDLNTGYSRVLIRATAELKHGVQQSLKHVVQQDLKAWYSGAQTRDTAEPKHVVQENLNTVYSRA